MANRSKSLFKGPNVKHYSLLYRSQRDPSINDPESSERVLVEQQRRQGGSSKGRTKADLESTLGSESLAHVRDNEGEAAAYGIYYDDTDYDYMQHLRGIGEYEAGPVTFVEAPKKNDVKGKAREIAVTLRDEQEQEQTYREFLESQTEEEGLRPDMDPSLREVLEALDDEAYVEDDEGTEVGEEGGDFFGALIGGSARGDAYRESPSLQDQLDEEDFIDDSVYSEQVAKFKKPAGTAEDSDEEFEDDSDEGRDTIAELRAASARRPPRASDRRSVASASAFSMSSSSMFRNDGLRTLDDRFDQIEQMYEDDSPSDEEDEEPSEQQSEIFNNVMDDFLDHYEIKGSKMRPITEGATPAEKLETLRSELSKMSVLESVQRQEREERLRRKRGEREEKEELFLEDKEPGAKWDCETILSTYSNLENHPRLLRLQKSLDPNGKMKKGTQQEQPAKISIDPKTGFPILLPPADRKSATSEDKPENDDDGDSDATMGADDINMQHKRQTIARSKDETPEQKKARKAEVKADRQARRQEKKQTKDTFGSERKRQQKMKAGKLSNAADVGRDNARGLEVMTLS